MRRIKDGDNEHKVYSNPNINLEITYYNHLKDLSKDSSISEITEAENELLQRRMAIADRIVTIRKRASVKQCELAEILGIAGAQLSRYENGKLDYTVELLFEISQIFASDPESSLDHIIFGKPARIDISVAEIFEGRTDEEIEQAAKLLRAHFGID